MHLYQTLSLLSGKGLMLPLSPMETTQGDDGWTSSYKIHDGYTMYRPTPLVLIIKETIAGIIPETIRKN